MLPDTARTETAAQTHVVPLVWLTTSLQALCRYATIIKVLHQLGGPGGLG